MWVVEFVVEFEELELELELLDGGAKNEPSVSCASLACDPDSGTHAMTVRHLAQDLRTWDHHLLDFSFQLLAKDTKAARPRHA